MNKRGELWMFSAVTAAFPCCGLCSVDAASSCTGAMLLLMPCYQCLYSVHSHFAVRKRVRNLLKRNLDIFPVEDISAHLMWSKK